MSAVFVLVLVTVVVALLALEKLRADLVALLALAALIVSGILEPGAALSGLSNPATVTVACMFVLTAGLQSSGLVRYLGDRLLAVGPSSTRLLVLGLGLLVGPVSAFLNNTAAVAVFLPIAKTAAHGKGISPSKLLMPMSFFAMLGGSCTLIGTSTNILVSSAAQGHGIRPFGMFEFTTLGIALFAAGAVYLVFVAPRLIPDRVPPESLTEGYHLYPYLSEVLVPDDSPMAGRTLAEARLGERYDLEVLGLDRGGDMVGLPLPEERLQSGDVLLVKAPAPALMKLGESAGLVVRHGRHPDDADLRSPDTVLLEAEVAPNSHLEGRTLKGVEFRRRYGATALAIRRHGEDIVEKIGEVPLRLGDELLLLTRGKSLESLGREPDLLVLQELDLQVFRPLHSFAALAIIAGVVAVAAVGALPIAEAAVVGSVLMVLTGCLPLRRAYDSVDWKVIFLLAGLIPMGTALESSGAAGMSVQFLHWLTGDLGPTAVLSAFYLFAALLTGFLSNNATAVLLVPLAVFTAQKLGVDSRPFLVALTFAASAAFYTPIGYQTNLLVYSPGGYRFADYLRVGAPLNLLCWVLATLLIPRLFPF